MTGYESKKKAAQDKLNDDDDTQVYKDHGDALLIAYQSGYYDGKKAAQEPVAKYCCHVCFNKSGQTFLDRMIICSECGNKRCPKATNHALPCTDSNEPNQAGSVFTNTPQPAQEPVCPECKAGVLYECVACSSNNYPPQRTWVGLTDEEIKTICLENGWDSSWQSLRFAQAIEAKLREKNT